MRSQFAVLLLLLFLPAAEVSASPDSYAAAVDLLSAQPEAAREWIRQQVEAHPESDSAWYALGMLHFYNQEFEPATDAFEEAVERNPASSLYELWLARCWGSRAIDASLFNKGRYANRFKDHVDLAIEKDPGNIDARMDRLQFFLQAPGIMGGGTDKAYEEVAAIAALDSLRGMEARINVLVAVGKPDQAEMELEQLIAETPEDSTMALQLVFMVQGRENWERAFAVLDSLVAERPAYGAALYQVGRTAVFSGKRLDEGIAALTRYIELGPAGPQDPQLTHAWWRLGQLHEAAGQPDSARVAYETALELDPENEYAAESLDKLEP